ncbi:hypothetical protein A2276_01935 [candidate division WOR-1 bacterium RIFOXYA12_FULL_43_27]|nr:MAG: hypothetical protein A2276_01935 [candidate division WOR-1 bacterium RIFOXYA12_FULL_43_27]OGC19518.1 MAG: hypothetical protein A2292_02395 [candidate division WOR-1 bacterium RIFOXYB2_FULL_46_45]
MAQRMPQWECWSQARDVSHPIDTSDIPGFDGWVNINGYRGREHDGFDFMAYRSKNDKSKPVLGLPPETIVHSVLDGIVLELLHPGRTSLYSEIYIAHAFYRRGTMLVAGYGHVNPTDKLRKGDIVYSGEPIGKIMAFYEGFSPQKYHLHFGACVALGSFSQDGSFCGQIYDYENSFDPYPLFFAGQELPCAFLNCGQAEWSEFPRAPKNVL